MTDSSAEGYRRALRWYPPVWRERNAETAIGVLLDRDDATGATGPTRRDRAALARAGLCETLLAAFRPDRRATTAIGVLFLLAAWPLAAVTLEVGRQAVTIVTTGFVDLVGRDYSAPVLLGAGILCIAWLCVAVAAARRGAPLLAMAIGLSGFCAAWATYHLTWPRLVPLLDLGAPILWSALLTVGALAGPVLGALAAARAGVLERSARRLVAVAAVAHVVGAWSAASMKPLASLAECLSAIGGALVAPAAVALTGVAFVLLSRPRAPRTSARSRARRAPHRPLGDERETRAGADSAVG